MTQPTQAVILAAGEGRRLGPLTELTPKPLLPFYGVSLLDWALEAVLAAGVKRVAINAHHLGDAIAAHVARRQRQLPQIELYLSREESLLGTGGAIRQLAPWLGQAPFYVVNADTVCLAPLEALTEPLSLLVTQEPAFASERRVRMGPHHLFEGLSPAAEPDAWTFCGLSRWDARLLALLPESGPSCLIRDGLLALHRRGERIHGVPHTAFFADLGTSERLVSAHLRAEPWIREHPQPLQRFLSHE